MTVVKRSARVPFSARQMFDLVNDIEAYPEFLGWCESSRVESATAIEITASIQVGVAGLRQTFRTRNRLTAPAENAAGRIDMALVSGPFKYLDGFWLFEHSDSGSRVFLELDYELAFSPLKMIIAPIFEEIARSQVSAFVDRAAEVYASAS